jgi:hypothetical protein
MGPVAFRLVQHHARRRAAARLGSLRALRSRRRRDEALSRGLRPSPSTFWIAALLARLAGKEALTWQSVPTSAAR